VFVAVHDFGRLESILPEPFILFWQLDTSLKGLALLHSWAWLDVVGE
jgi:hypothetical protein